jgi:PAS domain S-box-containing protein
MSTDAPRADRARAASSPSADRRDRLLSGVLSSIRDFAYAFDENGRFLFVNQQRLDLWGIPAEAAIGRNFQELGYPSELAAKLQRQILEVFKTGKSITDEDEYTSPTGVHGIYEYIYSPALRADGSVEFVVGSTRDISERKRAEETTRRLAQRLANALESIPDGFFTVDREWRFTYLNGEAERVMQRDGEPLLGRVLWEVFPHLLGTEFERDYRRAMRGEKGISFEAWHAPSAAWFSVNCHPCEDGLSVQFRNTTHTRAQRLQLELLQASVAQLNDHVLITEVLPGQADSRIVFVNDAVVRDTGRAREELLGTSPRLLQDPANRSELDRIHAARDSGEPIHTELMRFDLKGEMRWMDIDVVPINMESDGAVYRVSIARDITEHKRDREALRELNAELENRVAARTVDLERVLLAAEAASRAKSEFVAIVSHELRTPMNGVIGMIDVLGQTRLDREQTRMLALARGSADALMSIIDDILDFSKIEAGAVELDLEPLSIADIVERAIAVVTGVARDKNVHLSADVDPAIPSALLADNVRLRQILVNLMSNAIKFSRGRRRARVALSARLIAKDAELVTLDISVEDNGIGMDEAAIARLYRPFTQADVSTTRPFGGTGLGLAITRHFVELMGGTIDVRSTPDIGSVFTVRLPLRIASAPSAQDPLDLARGHEEKAVPGPAGKPGRPERVLVAEDNEMNREVVIQQLRRLGFSAEVAANGLEALELWRTRRFAIVLTDLQMPEMDGYGLTAAIRSEEGSGERIPIVALTANALKNEAGRCKAAGMDEYLIKPATLATLEATFDRLLSKEDAAEGPTATQPSVGSVAAVNPDVLASQIGDDPQLMGELFLEFAEAASDASVHLGHALKDGDWNEVRVLAHRTKDAARSVGALRLADLCAELEADAYDRDDVSISSVWRVFEDEVRSVCDWVVTRYGSSEVETTQ